MSYCSESDIQSEFKSIDFSASLLMTSAKVTGFINQADALIDGKIGGRYVVPISGTTSLLILKQVSILLVSDRVRKIVEVKSSDASANQLARKSEYKQAIDILDQIFSLKLTLPDAVIRTYGGGFNDYVYTNSITPDFDVTKVQW